jgi:hypothetical protein
MHDAPIFSTPSTRYTSLSMRARFVAQANLSRDPEGALNAALTFSRA